MERSNTNPFGSLLKQHRVAVGLTQEALAERAGIGVRTVKGMEQGDRHLPRADTLLRLIAALELTPEQAAALRGALRGADGDDAAAAGALAHTSLAPGGIRSLTPLIGRDEFVHDALALLCDDTTRLMTLVGPPGVGKTRIGLEIVRRAAHEGQFERVESIALAAIRQPSLVLPTIAHAVGIREVSGASLLDGLEPALRGTSTLLFLDNFEHLLDATPDIVAMLSSCAQLTILITSRAALRVRGEREMPVPPLAVPALVSNPDRESHSEAPGATTSRMIAPEQPSVFMPDAADIPVIAGSAVLRAPGATSPIADLMSVPSIALFVQRAQATLPDFALSEQNAPVLTAICRQLDGLPLALELAAARIRLFTPAEILTRLTNRLSILAERAPDLPSRQQTMRDAIAWSYLLLSTREQWTFRQLGIVANGCSLEAAETICARGASDGDAAYVLDDLTALAAHSLVHKIERADGTSHIIMLETIRDYALEQLDVHHERAAAAAAHCAYFCAHAESLAAHSQAGYESFDLKGLDDDYANLQTALGWAIDHGDVAIAERLVAGIWRYWYFRGILTEGRRWIESLFDLVGEVEQGWMSERPTKRQEAHEAHEASARSAHLAAALNGAGMIAFRQGDYATATNWLRRGLALQRWRHDKRGTAAVLNNLGIVAADQGLNADAQQFHEESLAMKRELGSAHDIAVSLNNLGCVARAQGQYAQATAYFEEDLAIQRARGDIYRSAHALGNLGTQAYVQGDYDQAHERYFECLGLQRQIGDSQGIALTTLNLAEVAKGRGSLKEALTEARESLAMFRALGEPIRIISALSLLASISYADRDVRLTQLYLREILDRSRNLASHRAAPQWATVLAHLAYDAGLYTMAVQFLTAADTWRKAQGTTWTDTEQREYDVWLEQAHKQVDASGFQDAVDAASAWSWQDLLANGRRCFTNFDKHLHQGAGA